MRFEREGIVFIGIGITVASVAMAFALYRRSWPLWLLAAALFVVALWIAYAYRESDRVRERADLTLRHSGINVLLGSGIRPGSSDRDDTFVGARALDGRAPS